MVDIAVYHFRLEMPVIGMVVSNNALSLGVGCSSRSFHHAVRRRRFPGPVRRCRVVLEVRRQGGEGVWWRRLVRVRSHFRRAVRGHAAIVVRPVGPPAAQVAPSLASLSARGIVQTNVSVDYPRRPVVGSGRQVVPVSRPREASGGR